MADLGLFRLLASQTSACNSAPLAVSLSQWEPVKSDWQECYNIVRYPPLFPLYALFADMHHPQPSRVLPVASQTSACNSAPLVFSLSQWEPVKSDWQLYTTHNPPEFSHRSNRYPADFRTRSFHCFNVCRIRKTFKALSIQFSWVSANP